jgi:hypothetical protein
MTARCSTDRRNAETALGFLENSVSVDVDGRIRTLKERIGEVEIISRKI